MKKKSFLYLKSFRQWKQLSWEDGLMAIGPVHTQDMDVFCVFVHGVHLGGQYGGQMSNIDESSNSNVWC